MSIRDAILERIKAPDADRQRLLDEMLDVLDEHEDQLKTMDTIEVLTMLLATIIATSANNRRAAEILVRAATWNMKDMVDREDWPDDGKERVH